MARDGNRTSFQQLEWVRATSFRPFPDRAAGRRLALLLRSLPWLDPRTAPHLIAVAERPR